MDREDPGRQAADLEVRAGAEDVIILPLVLVAVAVKRLCRAAFSLLIHILDYAFPILLQLARFPLFTVRILGDGIAALLKGIVGHLPVSGAKRNAWLRAVTERWAWLRQKISYKAFEEAVHHAFENGMAWVFRKCRRLTPGGALLVIGGAVLWLPISFGAATAIHAFLIAEASSLPAWMQLLHPFATLVAKSKLLVLPVYPAAWPQAKQHPSMQAMFALFRYVAGLRLVRKMSYRFRQVDHAVTVVADAAKNGARHLGLGRVSEAVLAGLNVLATSIGNASSAALSRLREGLSRVPGVRTVVLSYAAHYDGAGQQPAERVSQRVSGFFQRWSIKFSAEYYEAKERGEAPGHAPHGSHG